MSWLSRMLTGRKTEMRRGLAAAQDKLEQAEQLDDEIARAMARLRHRRERNNFGPAIRAAMRGHR